MKKLVSILALISILFSGCNSSKPKSSFTQEEVNKVTDILNRQKALIGTGYWKYVTDIEITTNSRNNPYYTFYMNDDYYRINDVDKMVDISNHYRNIQRGFEKLLKLDKEIQISTSSYQKKYGN